jgi:plastocyanin
LQALLGAALCLVVLAAPAAAKTKAAKETYLPRVEYPGMQKLTYKIGPLPIKPGADDIRFRGVGPRFRPSVPGYITRFRPTLTRADGSLPSVDIIHLHHAVWLINGYPTFAAGEEKSIAQQPPGFGWRYNPSDRWQLIDMIHNLETKPEDVYVVWEIDFVPDSAPAAASIKPVRTQWLDVAGLSLYPVFNSLRKQGTKGRFTFPNQARGAEAAKKGFAQEWTVNQDATIIGTVGHLHPGGLFTDLFIKRNGVKKRIFRSDAKYYGPAGPVTWDVAMYGTAPEWRVKVKKGDVVSVTATYDTSIASWYEGMGIMPLGIYEGTDAGGVDPFVELPPQQGVLTHGHLKENTDTAGGLVGLPDARTMTSSPFRGGTISVSDYFYGGPAVAGKPPLTGDLNLRGRVPTIQPGQSLTFDNTDWNATGVLHTITACKAPCNRRGGISFPLADGPVEFDSGNLGFGVGLGAGRTTWSTPKNLPAATYTYFCRIHPFMRGAFKVAAKSKKKS